VSRNIGRGSNGRNLESRRFDDFTRLQGQAAGERECLTEIPQVRLGGDGNEHFHEFLYVSYCRADILRGAGPDHCLIKPCDGFSGYGLEVVYKGFLKKFYRRKQRKQRNEI
jgi:hypothetical protein